MIIRQKTIELFRILTEDYGYELCDIKEVIDNRNKASNQIIVDFEDGERKYLKQGEVK